MKIQYTDTDGIKGSLPEGYLGYDKATADRGRVAVGTNTGDVLLAKKSEVDAVETHIRGEVDSRFANQINALAPYSGYTSVSKKLDNFVFQESSSFLNKVADKNRYVKFGDKVVDTYGDELVTGDSSTFDTSIGEWTNSGISQECLYIDNGKLVYDSTVGGDRSTQLSLNFSNLNIGKNYAISFDITSSNTSVSNVKIDAGGTAFVGESNTSLVGNVRHQEVLTARNTSGTLVLWLSGINSIIHTLDNISVREIQTAQFQVPEVAEIITDGSNTTSVAVNAGDYVVDGSELVVNGTFDTDTSGWVSGGSGGSINWDASGAININSDVNNTTDYAVLSTKLQLAPSTKYLLKYTVSGALTYSRYTYIVENGVAITPVTKEYTTGERYLEFTTTTGLNVDIYLGATHTTEATLYDNISVKRVSDTFRAKQDVPIGTSLTDTTYFEDRTEIGVTNQQLAYHAYNTLTNAYEDIKTEVLFSDVSKEDLLDNSVWMGRNGFSKVSEFLYSKGSYLCLPVGVVQC